MSIVTKNSAYLRAKIHPSLLLHIATLKGLRLRDVRLGKGVKLSNNVGFFNNPELFGSVSIGRYSSISGPGTRICAGVNTVSIGSYCSIASGVIIQEFNHNYRALTTYSIKSNIFKKNDKDDYLSAGPIIIEDDVWIGSNSIITSGVRVGRGAVIGAGTVVTKDVEPYSINVGIPSKRIGYRFSKEKIDEIEKSKWWFWSDEKVKKNEHFFQ